jgi:quinol monooxygenase YgiN
VIFIVVKHPVRPDLADDWPSLMAPMTEATRAEEGNLFFDWYRSADDPNCWLLAEGFRDQEAGSAHVTSEHFQAAMGRLPGMLTGVPEIVNVEVPGGWSQLAELGGG